MEFISENYILIRTILLHTIIFLNYFILELFYSRVISYSQWMFANPSNCRPIHSGSIHLLTYNDDGTAQVNKVSFVQYYDSLVDKAPSWYIGSVFHSIFTLIPNRIYQNMSLFHESLGLGMRLGLGFGFRG